MVPDVEEREERIEVFERVRTKGVLEEDGIVDPEGDE